MRARFRPVLGRMLLGLGLLALALGVGASARDLLGLWFVGNFVDTNGASGLSRGAASTLLGRAEFVLLAVSFATLLGAPRAMRRVAPSLSLLFRSPAPLLLGTVSIIALVTTLYGAVFFGGRTRFYLCDDAMVVMRYAKHLAMGLGPVYNPGEHVEGYTDPLWMAALAVLHLAKPPDALAPLFVLIANWVCVAIGVVALVRTLARLGCRAGLAVAAGLAFALDVNTLEWTVSGLETPALTAATAVAMLSLVARRPRAFAASLALVPLLRSDGALLAAALGAVWLHLADDRPRALRLLLAAALPTALFFVFRLAYYGDLFPNTYYLKKLALGDRLRTGIGGYGLRVAFLYGVPLVLSGATLASSEAPRVVRGLSCVVFFQIVYGIYVGGDIFAYTRFFTPVVPLLLVTATVAVREVARARPHGPAVLAAVGLSLPVRVQDGVLAWPAIPNPSFWLGSQVVADLVRANVPKSALVTINPAGTTAYFAIDHPFLDVLGKNDRKIAHSPGYRGVMLGHNRFDFDYVYDERRPAVAFVHNGCTTLHEYVGLSRSDVEQKAGVLPESFSPSAIFELGHPTFQARYATNRVQVVGKLEHDGLGCLFVRDDSGLPMFWSLHGPPPRLRDVTVGFQSADERAVFGGEWLSVADGGPQARRSTGKRPAYLDLWMDTGAPLLVEACFDGPFPETLVVNGVPLPAQRDGACARSVVPREVLGRRAASTRIDFPHEVRLLRVRARVAP